MTGKSRSLGSGPKSATDGTAWWSPAGRRQASSHNLSAPGAGNVRYRLGPQTSVWSATESGSVGYG